MNDLNCPYCHAELDVCHDEGQGYEEGVNHEMQCGKCKKNFVFQTSILFYYEAKKADCLNDSQHDWKPQNAFPKFFTKMQCSMCGEERKPSEKESKSKNQSAKNSKEEK